ncbi:uncharacterized protein LOC112576979 isoform X2 [Pomacea canaliculata]|uniref:uncharacterized protein LOC112576979 isoform X2 n=1 Tax=Pomacea canaliculata TaxID=400727 RepID=UPI000D739398|nr:uncharacterized protein LOC112576979 isoform X2 [Pomacea canaliculata]
MGKKKEKISSTVPCRAATTATIEVDSTYYNLTSTSNHPHHNHDHVGSADNQTSAHPVAQSVNTTQSSSASSSSSSAMSSESEAGGPHLSLMQRPPMHPAMLGIPQHSYFPGPYGMPPLGYGPHAAMMGHMMPPYSSPPFPPFGPALGGGGPGAGLGIPRQFPHEDHDTDDRVHKLKNPNDYGAPLPEAICHLNGHSLSFSLCRTYRHCDLLRTHDGYQLESLRTPVSILLYLSFDSSPNLHTHTYFPKNLKL